MEMKTLLAVCNKQIFFRSPLNTDQATEAVEAYKPLVFAEPMAD